METCFNKQDQEKIQIIIRQTDYTEEQAINKYIFYNKDEQKVIRDFFGLPLKQEKGLNNYTITTESLNQEIYNQFRKKLIIEKDVTNLGSK